MTTTDQAGDRPAEVPGSTSVARFAGLVMVVLGIVQSAAGVAALLGGGVPDAAPRHLMSLGAAAWGWVHLLLGVFVGLAGMFVIVGVLWGRLVGIGLTALSVVALFASVSHHPAWSVVGMALGLLVIWALCVFDEAASAASPTMLD